MVGWLIKNQLLNLGERLSKKILHCSISPGCRQFREWQDSCGQGDRLFDCFPVRKWKYRQFVPDVPAQIFHSSRTFRHYHSTDHKHALYMAQSFLLEV